MPSTAPASLKSHIITQTIAIVVCVVVPAIVTLMAPLTDLELRRAGSGATVTITRYVLMLIPWQTKQVPNVTELVADITPGFRYANTAENRRKGRAGTVSHETGQLLVVSDGPEVIVQAAPELAEDISARFAQYLASGSSEPVRISVYASWSLSYLVGGALSALAAFYIVCACLAVISLVVRTVRNTPA